MQTPKLGRIWIAALILVTSAILARSSQPSGIRSSLTDQVVINTQRLSDLERRMQQLERGGSSLASDTAARVTIVGIKLEALQKEVDEMRSVGVAVIGLIITYVIGVILNRLFGRTPPRSHRRD